MSSTLVVNPLVHGIILFPLIAISIITFFQFMYSMNRWRGLINISRPQQIGFLILTFASLIRWCSSMANIFSLVYIQFISGMFGSVFVWTAFVIIYNDTLTVPSRQQLEALVFQLVASGLWELVARLVSDAMIIKFNNAHDA